MHPKDSDLLRYIVPKFAAKWRDLGTYLEIPSHSLDTIAADHPSDSKKCCNTMLQEWKKISPYCTWDKLQKAINLLSHVSVSSHNDSSKSKYVNIK